MRKNLQARFNKKPEKNVPGPIEFLLDFLQQFLLIGQNISRFYHWPKQKQSKNISVSVGRRASRYASLLPPVAGFHAFFVKLRFWPVSMQAVRSPTRVTGTDVDQKKKDIREENKISGRKVPPPGGRQSGHPHDRDGRPAVTCGSGVHANSICSGHDGS